MIVYLANKTRFREKPHGKVAQASCLFLENVHTDPKATGRMPETLPAKPSIRDFIKDPYVLDQCSHRSYLPYRRAVVADFATAQIARRLNP
jgi:hypothetical protein